MEKVKVLYFVDRMLRGGIQSLLIDWIPRFNNQKIQVDFLLLDDGKNYELEETLKEFGCKVFKLKGIWLNTPFDYIKYCKTINKFFKLHNDYKVVHLHSSSKNFPILKYAKKYKIPCRISHSHNIDFQTDSKLKKFVGNLLKIQLIKDSTDFFACSKLAGEWLFGNKIVKSDKFKVIHNAIDYNRFKFNHEVRETIRKELEVSEETIVLGNVARFENQKNHKFLIDIFYFYQKEVPNSKLLLIGEGTLENEIKEKVKKLNIAEKVIFLGYRKNVNDFMQTMDYFIFPSLYEGLGLVLVEAQANGLKCFTSKGVVPEEVKIINELEFINLSNTAQEWAKLIPKKMMPRIDSYYQLRKKEYLIEEIVGILEDKYISENKEG